MMIANECIHEVWKHEQEILDVVHKLCINNNLKYSLMFGSLLGAVRHGGFIPWDDDIDIIMPREDYEKLISLWPKEAPTGYLLQNKRTDSDFTQNFTKIRKDHTTFIQNEEEKKRKYHKGIFIDVFPADRVAPDCINRTFQYIANAINLLCARGYCSGNKGIIGGIEKIILNLPESLILKLYNNTEKYISRWNNNHKCKWYSPNTINVCRRYFTSDMFENIIMIRFNGAEYCCVRDYDKLLVIIYGNYLELPSVEERKWKHHPIVVDFENNYED